MVNPMTQTIIVIFIVFLAVIATAVKLYRFFHPSPGRGHCSPDACASCPYNHAATCDEKKS